MATDDRSPATRRHCCLVAEAIAPVGPLLGSAPEIWRRPRLASTLAAASASGPPRVQAGLRSAVPPEHRDTVSASRWLLRGPGSIGADGIAALDALPLTTITQSPDYRVRATETLDQDTLTIYERA